MIAVEVCFDISIVLLIATITQGKTFLFDDLILLITHV